jgi:hypothetical protein
VSGALSADEGPTVYIVLQIRESLNVTKTSEIKIKGRYKPIKKNEGKKKTRKNRSIGVWISKRKAESTCDGRVIRLTILQHI